MNAEFVDRIENPQHPQLEQQQETAWGKVEEQLGKFHMNAVPDYAIRRLTYAYYHDWEAESPRYLFLLQDPGLPKEHVIAEMNEYVELGPDCDPHDAIQIDRRFGARWLVGGDYTRFTREFLETCADHRLIDLDIPWWQYVLSGQFFNDFYMGDVIKYREAKTNQGNIQASFTEFLIHELEYLDPELIFTFGGSAWGTLRERLGVETIEGGPAERKIGDVHGVPHRATRLIETDVLPLGHPSGNYRGSQITHQAYIDRFAAGLRDWASNSS